MSRRTLSIWISKSECIFKNLALEDWLFKNHDFSNNDGVLIWRNHPTVVIGRHQNPWLEANLPFLQANNINLARRKSGGGTVYHDMGNLNFSFLTTKQRHKRKKNLELIADWLRSKHALPVERNDRDDLVLQPGDRKVSGTAARLTHDKAYHHFTLMVDVDLKLLGKGLKSTGMVVSTRATNSIRSKVGCLKQETSSITVNSVLDTITEQLQLKYQTSSVQFLDLDQTECFFAGLDKIETELRSWNWIFGLTPKFQATIATKNGHLLVLTVEKGLIVEVDGPKNYQNLISTTFEPHVIGALE